MDKYEVVVEGSIDFNICRDSNVRTDGGDFERLGNFDSGDVHATIEWYLTELQSKISPIVEVRLEVEANDEYEAEEKAKEYVMNELIVPTIEMYGKVFEGEFTIYSIEVNKL